MSHYRGLAEVQPGDTLWLVTGSRYSSDREVTVSRVGRKWLYILDHYGREQPTGFSIETGAQNDGRFSSSAALYTLEQRELNRARDVLWEALWEAGVRLEGKLDRVMDNGALADLLAVVHRAQVGGEQ